MFCDEQLQERFVHRDVSVLHCISSVEANVPSIQWDQQVDEYLWKYKKKHQNIFVESFVDLWIVNII